MKKLMMIAAVAATFVSCGGGGGRPNFGDNEYPVATVDTSTADMQNVYPATIRGIQDVEIRPKVQGFLTKINVTEGQTVKEGQTLFTIDDETYRAQVRQAQAASNAAEKQMRTAKLTYENAQVLYDNKVIGDYELQTSHNAYETSCAQYEQSQAVLASAKESLSFCYVKSPVSGVVGTLPLKEGALVNTSNVLTTVSDVSSVDVYFSVTERYAMRLSRKGESVNAFPPVRLRLSDGTIYTHEGKVTRMSGIINSSTGSVQVIATFPNTEKLLTSGGVGNIIVPNVKMDAVVIPQSCVSEIQDKKFVYLVGKDNKVKYSEIKVDAQNDGNNYVVTEGLKPGDKYVTNGITKLSDGMEIVPITPEQYQKKISNQAKAMSSGDIVGAMKNKK